MTLFTLGNCVCCGVYTAHDLCTAYTGSSGLWRSSELWRFSTSTRGWDRADNTAANGTGPSARSGHVMTSVGLDLWVHGGYTETGEGDTCATHVALLLLPQ
jgi:hypothetical protein